MITKYLCTKLLLLNLAVFLFSCQKEVSFENSPGTTGSGGSGNSGGTGSGGSSGGNSNATYYYKATIGGTNYYQDVTLTNNYIPGSGLGGVDDVELSAGIEPMAGATTGLTEFEVTKGLLHNYLSLTDAQFKAFFKAGTYPFTTGPDSDPFKNGDGVYIYWVDKQGKIWSSTDGAGDQTGSNFKIISVEDAADPVHYYIRVKMQFNCKLYKEGTGEMIQLTNGEMVGLFGKI